MAFIELSPVKSNFGGRDAAKNSVRANISTTGQVRIAVSGDLVEIIGSPKACRILLGTKEHAGHAAVVPQTVKTKGTYSFHSQKRGKQSSLLVMAKRLGVPTERRAAIDLPHQVSATGIIIDLRPLTKPAMQLVA